MPYRWSLVWRVPAAIALGAFAVACFAIDDCWQWCRRQLNRRQHAR